MAAIEDHDYLKLCAELASCWTISLSSARRKVEFVAVQEGVRDISSRKAIALRLIEQSKSTGANSKDTTIRELDRLLEALAEEDNFMVED